MNRNRWIMAAAGVLLLLVLGAFAFDKSRDDKIANGVTIGGIDVSGLNSAEAKARLDRDIQSVVQTPIVVVHNGQKRTLKPDKSKVGVDINGMVNEAVTRSNNGFFLTNAAKAVAGSSRNIAIATDISYSKKAVNRFVASAHKTFDSPAVNASIVYHASNINIAAAKPGSTVVSKELADKIVNRLKNPTESRTVSAPMHASKAKLQTRAELAKKYPTILLVDRENFKLHLLKNLKIVKTYGVSVGRIGLETPAGTYSITDRQVNPSWHVPNSAWAGDLAGKTIPPGPDDPIVARWLGIMDGVGIHGTDEPGSIGSAASHGCIRMLPADVIQLYPQVPLGTPVYIG